MTTNMFTRHFAQTPLQGRPCVVANVPHTSDDIVAVHIEGHEVEAMWRAAQALVPVTTRAPVVVDCYPHATPWHDDITSGALFSRHLYKNLHDTVDVSPRAILARANDVDVSAFIAQLVQEQCSRDDLEDVIEYELDATRRRCGSAPPANELKQALPNHPTRYDVDRWLLDWEDRNGLQPKPAFLEWFEPELPALLFLPTTDSWDALAYYNFFGAAHRRSECWIALGRSWHLRFGAQLVAHYGTMLQCLVPRPPASLSEAWQLACEHDLAAGSTLNPGGIPVRIYARGLMQTNRWFLHDRP